VVACPPSLGYRLRKTVQRHKTAFATTAMVAAVLILGAVASLSEAIRAKRAEHDQSRLRAAAQQEAAKSEQVAQFLKDMLKGVGPSVARGRDTRLLREILDQTAQRLDRELKGQPAVAADLLETLSAAYLDSGDYTNALEMSRQALALRQTLYGKEHPDVAASLYAIGQVLQRLDRVAESEAAERQALAVRQKLLGPTNLAVAQSLHALAWALMAQNRNAEAETNLNLSLAMRQKLTGGEDLDFVQTLSALGTSLTHQGRLSEAEAALRRALAIYAKLHAYEYPTVVDISDALGWILRTQGKPGEAEAAFRKALEISRAALDPSHPGLRYPLVGLAWSLHDEGKFAEAEAPFREALAITKKVLGEHHPDVATLNNGLALSLQHQDKFAEAEAAFREALAITKEVRGEQHPDVAALDDGLARTLEGQGKLPEAEQIHRESLPVWAKCRGVDSAGYADGVRALGAVLKAENKPAEVETLYQEVLSAQRAALGNDSAAVAATLGSLAESLQAQGKKSEAEKASYEALEIILKPGMAFSDRVPPLLRQQTEILAARGKAQEAEKLYEEAIKGARQKLGDTNLILGELLHDYGEFLSHEFKWEAAVEYRLKSLPIRRTVQNDNLAWTLRDLGSDLISIGRTKEAEGYLREALALYHKLHQQEDFYATGWAGEKLGEALTDQGRLPEAEQALREALRAYTTCNGVGQPEYLEAMGRIEGILALEDKPAEAGRFFEETLAQERAALGETNVMIAFTLAKVANFLTVQNHTNEAASRYREALAIASNALAKATNALILNNLAWALVVADKPASWDGAVAVELGKKSVAATDRKEPNYLDTLAAAYSVVGQFTNAVRVEQEAVALSKTQVFADCLKLYQSNLAYRDHNRLATLTLRRLVEGKYAEAEALARECLATREIVIPDDFRTFNARSMLGGSLLGQRKYQAAEPLLLSGYEGLKQREDKIPAAGKPRPKEALERLVRLYEETNRPDEAARWKKLLAELDAGKQ
jgi:tetratricopeptide (TPR) repeat protein